MKRRRLWAVLFTVAIAVLVLLLVLIGVGYLRLPSSSPAMVTVSEIEWTIEQGSTSDGQGWFGPSHVNDTANQGAPYYYTAGTTFQLSWSAFNRDTANHTVYSVSTLAPFSFVGAHPTLPATVPGGDDSFGFAFDFSTPSSTSGTYVMYITLNALGAG